MLLIAILHGLPVYVVGVWKQSKSWMTIALFTSIALGVYIGNSKYVGVDIVASLIGYYVGWISLSRNPEIRNAGSHSDKLNAILSKVFRVTGILLALTLVATGLYQYAVFKHRELDKASTAINYKPAPTVSQPAISSQIKSRNPTHTESEITKANSKVDEAKANKEAYCLSLTTDVEKIECLDSY